MPTDVRKMSMKINYQLLPSDTVGLEKNLLGLNKYYSA